MSRVNADSSRALLPPVLVVSVSTVGLSILSTHRAVPSEATQLVLSFALALVIALWVRADRRKRSVSVHYEFDTFVFFFWYVAMPYYLYKTRGWRGPMMAFGIAILVATPTVVSTVLSVVARLRG